MIINGENLIVGRVATLAAKKALLGEEVYIVNCEHMYITGGSAYLKAEVMRRRNQGTWSKGPFYYRMPDRFVKRIIRGMLPHKTARGNTAYKRIHCFIGVPSTISLRDAITLPQASITKVPNLKYMRIGDLAAHMGAKVLK